MIGAPGDGGPVDPQSEPEPEHQLDLDLDLDRDLDLDLEAARWHAIKASFLRLTEDAATSQRWLAMETADLDLESRRLRLLVAADRAADEASFLDPGDALGEEHDDEAGDDASAAGLAPGELMSGDILGRCRILRLAGRGGMGEVYEALDLGLSLGDERDADRPLRRVAVKILSPWWIGPVATTALATLDREVATLARIRHPGVARVHRAGMDRAVSAAPATVSTADRSTNRAPVLGRRLAYVVLEFIEGRPLLEHARQTLGPETSARSRAALAIDLGRQLADAVAAAHAQRVIHRDLKSSNVLVRADGTLVVIDFGIARILRDEAESIGTSAGDTILTNMSSNLDAAGTIGAISPERARGRAGGAGEDVWAIGGLLFQLVTGRPPQDLAGLPPLEALRRIGDRPPPPIRSVDRDVPRDLATVIDRCLAFEPGDRYPHAAAVRDELERVAGGLPPRARQVGRIGRGLRLARRHPLPSTLVATLVIGSLAASLVLARFAAVAARERDRATQREQTVQRFADNLMMQVARDVELLPGSLPTLARLLEMALEYVEEVAPAEDDLTAAGALALARPLLHLGAVHYLSASPNQTPEVALRAIDRGIRLCELAVRLAPEDPVILGTAAAFLRPVIWSQTIDRERELRLWDEWVPDLARRALQHDPDQKEARAVLAWRSLTDANFLRLDGRRIEAIEMLERVLQDVRMLAREHPTDADVAELHAIAEGANSQQRQMAVDAGHDIPVRPAAEAFVASARAAMELSRSLSSTHRYWWARGHLGRVLASEGLEEVARATALMDEAAFELAELARTHPNSWSALRFLSVLHFHNIEARLCFADAASHDPSAERRFLEAASREVDACLRLLDQRARRNEIVWRDDLMVNAARQHRRTISARLAVLEPADAVGDS